MCILWRSVVVAVGFLLASAAAIIICSEDTTGIILEGPQDVTVFENETAMFSCVTEINRNAFGEWDINGTRHVLFTSESTFTVRLLRNGSTEFTQYVYFLPARARLNNSLIQCRVFETMTTNRTYTCSDNATLFIQGPPEAVIDLRVDASISEVVVSWLSPFTLDVTGVEYDITYSLLIFNVTDQNQHLSVPCDLCHNLTLTHFVFHPPDPLSGQSFNFTVTPQNGAGAGPSTGPLTATLTNSSHDDGSSSSEAPSPSTTQNPYTSASITRVLPTYTLTPHNTKVPVGTPSVRPTTTNDDVITTAVIAAITSAVALLLVAMVISLGVLIRWHRNTIKLQQNPVYGVTTGNGSLHINSLHEVTEMQNNPVYGINNSIEMQNNPVYGVNNRIEMQPNPVYGVNNSIKMQNNPVYGVNNSIKMQNNPVYGVNNSMEMQQNQAYIPRETI